MTITHNNSTAYIGRHERTDKWIFCCIFDGLVESDDLGARHGQFPTRKQAIEAFKREAMAFGPSIKQEQAR